MTTAGVLMKIRSDSIYPKYIDIRADGEQNEV